MMTLKITKNEEEAKEQLRAFVPGVKAEDYHVDPYGFNILTIGLFTIAKYLNENSGTEVFNYESIFHDMAFRGLITEGENWRYEYDGMLHSKLKNANELCSEIDAIIKDQWIKITNYINTHMRKCNINVIDSLASSEFTQYFGSILNPILLPSSTNDNTELYDLSTIRLYSSHLMGIASKYTDERLSYPKSFDEFRNILIQESPIDLYNAGPYWHDKIFEFFGDIINYIIGNQRKMQNIPVNNSNNQQPSTNSNDSQQATANSTTQAQSQQQGPINLASWINYEPINGKSNLESINVTNNSDLGNVPDTYEECSPEQKGRKMSVKDSLEKFAKQQSLDVDDFMGQYENFVGNKINLDSLPTEETIKANEKNMLRGMLDSLEKFMSSEPESNMGTV